MPDDQPPAAAVSEASPGGELYIVPEHIEYRPQLKKKMLRRGPKVLSAAELLAVIVGPTKKQKAESLSRRHGLEGLVGLTIADLRGPGELGDVAAMRVAAALELHRRLTVNDRLPRPRLTRPADVHAQVRDIADLRKEQLVGLFLDAQNGV